MLFNCVKKLHEKLNWMFSGTAQISHQVCQFLFGQFFVCSCVCVAVVDKNRAAVCCFLATSVIILSEKRKESVMCAVRSGILKGIYHVLLICWMNCLKLICLEIVPWFRQVNWGNCGIACVNCAVLCVKDDWKVQFWGLRYCLSKLRSLLSFSVRYDVTQ